MKISPPVVKIVVSVRSPAGVIYDRGSRVLADQWANPRGFPVHKHALCVCVCVSVVFISLLYIL